MLESQQTSLATWPTVVDDRYVSCLGSQFPPLLRVSNVNNLSRSSFNRERASEKYTFITNYRHFTQSVRSIRPLEHFEALVCTHDIVAAANFAAMTHLYGKQKAARKFKIKMRVCLLSS